MLDSSLLKDFIAFFLQIGGVAVYKHLLTSIPYNTPIFYLYFIPILISVDLFFPSELPLGHLSLFYLCKNNPKCPKWSLTAFNRFKYYDY